MRACDRRHAGNAELVLAMTRAIACAVTVPAVAHGIYVDHCGAFVVAPFFDSPQQPYTSFINTTQPPPYSVTLPPL